MGASCHGELMTVSRHLEWEGCWNARDLGEIRTSDGQELRRHAVARSDHLRLLTPAGWSALHLHGIRTIVDLRSTWEVHRDQQSPPASITTVHVPLEDGLAADPQFSSWVSDGLLGTPLYYRPFLRRWPERCAAAIAAVASANPHGVVIHCSKGCDRTGLLVLLLLVICGVGPEEIIADYELTRQRLCTPLARGLGREDDTEAIQEVLLQNGYPSLRCALLDFLHTMDIPACLVKAGLSDADIRSVRRRLIGS